MEKDRLLAEMSDIIRTMPSRDAFTQHQDATTIPWLGRAFAAIEQWDGMKIGRLVTIEQGLRPLNLLRNSEAFPTLSTLLHQAQADLQLELGRTGVVVDTGQVFQYFEELRKWIEAARVDVLFVDRYLDADFVARYLPYVAAGVSIRLLGRDRIATLLPAVDAFSQESKRRVEVRSSNAIHDRYLLIDRAEGYLSGASFKDGAKHSPALISKITDTFQATWDIYDRHWNAGKVHR